jgi:uncharacterized repeat protein (TIGR03803 family)
VLTAVAISGPVGAAAQTSHTIYTFQAPTDGWLPFGVVLDPTTGRLYGATRSGGNLAPCPANSFGNISDGIPFPGCGVLFELTPAARGAPWTKTTSYKFMAAADGAFPNVPTFRNGALYGTAEFGGDAKSTTCQTGCGTVFRFDLAAGTLQTLHTFTGGSDSGGPYSGVVIDSHGVLYGDVEGGNGARPTQDLVYSLSPAPPGQSWNFTALHPSTGGGDDESRSGLALDRAGNIYGLTIPGALFVLTPPGYAETTLFTFTDGAGGVNQTALTIGYLPSGAPVLYGVTKQGGGPNNAGTVFKFDPATRTLTTLHTFTGGADGGRPFTPLVNDASGVLYGTTFAGGNLSNCAGGCGTVFKLDPATSTLTTLHAFAGGADGAIGTGLALGANGRHLYGTTAVGGNSTNCPAAGGLPSGCGTVFEVSTVPALQVSPATDIVVLAAKDGARPSPFSYELSATFESVNFSISGIPSWLNASFTSGTATTSPLSVTFDFEKLRALGCGTYHATLHFKNTGTNEGDTSRTVTLRISDDNERKVCGERAHGTGGGLY